MKLIKSLAVILLALSMTTACKSGGANPEATAEKFIKAVQGFDFEEAKKYSSKESAAMIDMMKGFMAAAPAEELEKQKAEAKNTKIEVISSNVAEDGNTATVTLKATTPDGNSKEDKIDLVKEDGEWKVNFKK